MGMVGAGYFARMSLISLRKKIPTDLPTEKTKGAIDDIHDIAVTATSITHVFVALLILFRVSE